MKKTRLQYLKIVYSPNNELTEWIDALCCKRGDGAADSYKNIRSWFLLTTELFVLPILIVNQL